MSGVQGRREESPLFRAGALRCPFCHDELRHEEVKRGCGSCMAWHHASCLDESGACASCGAALPSQASPSKLCLAVGCKDAALDDPELRDVARLCASHARAQLLQQLVVVAGFATVASALATGFLLYELTSSPEMTPAAPFFGVVALVIGALALALARKRSRIGAAPRPARGQKA